MAKKVKCMECDNSMDWSIPNIGKIKGDTFLQDILKNTIVCSYTMKTKTIDHCQYCKHYEHNGDFRQKCRKNHEKSLEKVLKEVGVES